MKILLAADIGGSKTRLRLIDTSGMIVSEFVGAGAAAIFDSENPLTVLDKQLEALPNKEYICAIAVNLGGRNIEQVRLSFRHYFPDIPLSIFRESEGTAAYVLARNYGAQIVLMAGTGAIAVGNLKGMYVTTGGWGANIGDDGSGYDIGLQAIRLSLRAVDGAEAITPMVQHICGTDKPISAYKSPDLIRYNRDKIREKLAPLDRRHIASFTNLVAEYAEQGDKNAMYILENAGIKLAATVICCAKKLNMNISPTVVVTGGLINISKYWSQSFEASICRVYPGTKFHYVNDGLLLGVCNIVKELFEENKGIKKL